MGDIGLSCLGGTTVCIVSLPCNVWGTLYIAVLSMVLSVLGSSVVSLALIALVALTALVALNNLTLWALIVETIGPALAPCVPSVSRKGARICTLNAVAVAVVPVIVARIGVRVSGTCIVVLIAIVVSAIVASATVAVLFFASIVILTLVLWDKWVHLRISCPCRF